MAIHFQEHYKLLELDSKANWETANRNYRRLVHAWHPDRFAQRPREKEHAQQQFIELTKAFNSLRTYYREYHRLPYQQLTQAVADSPEPAPHQKITPDDATAFESGILNKRKPSPLNRNGRNLKPLLWALPAVATIFAGLFTFAIVDRNAKLATIEEAKRVLRNAKPSEYMADDEAISQANSRAVMLNRSGGNGKIGDKLVRDMFK